MIWVVGGSVIVLHGIPSKDTDIYENGFPHSWMLREQEIEKMVKEDT
jgi:hypothetical protein